MLRSLVNSDLCVASPRMIFKRSRSLAAHELYKDTGRTPQSTALSFHHSINITNGSLIVLLTKHNSYSILSPPLLHNCHPVTTTRAPDLKGLSEMGVVAAVYRLSVS